MKEGFRQCLEMVFKARGDVIWSSPQMLYEELISRGGDPVMARSLQLILESCPPIGNALKSRVSSKEAESVLVGHAVRASHLEPSVVRHILHEAFRIVSGNGERLSDRIVTLTDRLESLDDCSADAKETRSHHSAVLDSEDEDYRTANRILHTKGDIASALVDMRRLSDAGNMYAAYELANFYYQQGQERVESFSVAEDYYLRAAELGYASANGGAMASEMRKKDGSIERATELMERAGALYGPDGEEWLPSLNILREYREHDHRFRKILLLVIMLGMLASLFSLSISVSAGVISLVIGVGATAYCIYRFITRSYASVMIPVGLIIAQWTVICIALV